MEFVDDNGCNNKKCYRWQVGGGTDIGGGRENQDNFFVWESKEKGIIILCVLDGHGREVGKLAIEAGRACLENYFESNSDLLFNDPYKMIVEGFQLAHACIKSQFVQRLESIGWEIKESDEGYLLKRKPNSQTWYCVHGGTSCSIVAIVGSKVYCANVGDSTGLLCADSLLFEKITNSDNKVLKPIGDAADPHRINNNTIYQTQVSTMETTMVTDCALVITAEHSPESLQEFDRLRKHKTDANDSQYPALQIVYDAQMTDKHRCPRVFEVDASGSASVTNKGKYYKNVRQEWASLVATPTTARFQDALAFTRSMGDFHLHVYGVTHLPEVFELDLEGFLLGNKIQYSNNSNNNSSSSNNSNSHSNNNDDDNNNIIPEPIVCFVLASDGVWDNWTYQDVSRFMMDSSCIEAVRSGSDGAERVAESFMQRNATYSKRNFGNQADNATSIVLYLCDDDSFVES